MSDCPVSVETLREQVDREGAPWGLCAVVEGDRVFVAEIVPQAEGSFGLVDVSDGPHRILCHVDDEHPFSAVLANRLQNGETDLAQRARNYDVFEKKKQAAEIEARDNEIRERWRVRKKIVSLPGIGIVNREQRRADAALRRRAR